MPSLKRKRGNEIQNRFITHLHDDMPQVKKMRTSDTENRSVQDSGSTSERDHVSRDKGKLKSHKSRKGNSEKHVDKWESYDSAGSLWLVTAISIKKGNNLSSNDSKNCSKETVQKLFRSEYSNVANTEKGCRNDHASENNFSKSNALNKISEVVDDSRKVHQRGSNAFKYNNKANGGKEESKIKPAKKSWVNNNNNNLKLNKSSCTFQINDSETNIVLSKAVKHVKKCSSENGSIIQPEQWNFAEMNSYSTFSEKRSSNEIQNMDWEENEFCGGNDYSVNGQQENVKLENKLIGKDAVKKVKMKKLHVRTTESVNDCEKERNEDEMKGEESEVEKTRKEDCEEQYTKVRASRMKRKKFKTLIHSESENTKRMTEFEVNIGETNCDKIIVENLEKIKKSTLEHLSESQREGRVEEENPARVKNRTIRQLREDGGEYDQDQQQSKNIQTVINSTMDIDDKGADNSDSLNKQSEEIIVKMKKRVTRLIIETDDEDELQINNRKNKRYKVMSNETFDESDSTEEQDENYFVVDDDEFSDSDDGDITDDEDDNGDGCDEECEDMPSRQRKNRMAMQFLEIEAEEGEETEDEDFVEEEEEETNDEGNEDSENERMNVEQFIDNEAIEDITFVRRKKRVQVIDSEEEGEKVKVNLEEDKTLDKTVHIMKKLTRIMTLGHVKNKKLKMQENENEDIEGVTVSGTVARTIINQSYTIGKDDVRDKEERADETNENEERKMQIMNEQIRQILGKDKLGKKKRKNMRDCGRGHASDSECI